VHAVSETLRTDDWRARAERAEARLDELAAERARLWEEVHRLRAERRAVEHYERVAGYMEHSASWRLTRPLRDAKRLALLVRRKLADRP
jgi:hypothetical protein